jgi:hypothetical protein
MEKVKTFICSCTKTEIAMLYTKGVSPATAVRILRRWINNNEELKKALEQNNYKKHCHILTPKQVQIIFEYLGEP